MGSPRSSEAAAAITLLSVFLGLWGRSEASSLYTCNSAGYGENPDFASALDYSFNVLLDITPQQPDIHNVCTQYPNPPLVFAQAICKYESSQADCALCLAYLRGFLLVNCAGRIGGRAANDICYLSNLGRSEASSLYACNSAGYGENPDFASALDYTLSLLLDITPQQPDIHNVCTQYPNPPLVFAQAICKYESSQADCALCLSYLRGFLLANCAGRIGGRAGNDLCNLRYENYYVCDM
nr:antifungal protein ginkbilobin-2-like [Ipomoea batatas]